MPPLDASGQELLRRFSERDPDRFADVASVTARDQDDRIAITIDAVRRVERVEVLDIGAVRQPDKLEDAVREAFGIADGERQYAVLSAAGRGEDALKRARERVFAPADLHTPPKSMVSREASTERRLAREERRVRGLEDTSPPPAPQVSENGYLTIQRAKDATVVSVVADPEWLSGARPENLERAILQAAHIDGGQ